MYECDSSIHTHTHVVQECFCAHFWKNGREIGSLYHIKLSIHIKAGVLFNLTFINISVMCPSLIPLTDSWNWAAFRYTRTGFFSRFYTQQQQQLYNVSPYNNKHWIIDILPELFKVTFIHSECWICTEVINEMEIWLESDRAWIFFYWPPSYLFVALGQATFFYI